MTEKKHSKEDARRLKTLRAALDWHVRQKHRLILVYPPAAESTRRGEPIAEPNRGKMPVFGYKPATRQQIVAHAVKLGNFGWLVGHEHLVLDVDTRNPEAQESFECLVADVGGLPLTRIIRTGSGGWHEYYSIKLPPGVTLRQNHPSYPGIDFITGNHFVVTAGSQHRSGNLYVVERDAPIAPAPQKLIEILAREVVEHTGRGHYDAEELSWILVPDQNAVGYDDWIKVGMGIHYEVGEDGFELFDAWSSKSPKYDAAETRRKWDSFGVTHKGTPVTGGTVEQILREHRPQRTPRQTAQKRAGDEFEEVGAEVATPAAAPGHAAANGGADGKKLIPKAAAQMLRTQPIDDTPPPPVEFVIQDWLQRGRVGTLVAEGSVGKTTFVLNTMIDVALGLDWQGEHAVLPGRSVLISRDDAQEDLDTALKWICRDRGITGADFERVADQVRVYSIAGVEGGRLVQPIDRGHSGYERTAYARWLVEHLATIEDLRIVAFDTARQFVGADTNDEAAGATLLEVGKAIASVGARPSVFFLHHTGKAVARASVIDMYAGIGSSVYADNSRFVWRLNQLSTEEVSKLAVPGDFAWGPDDSVFMLTSTRGSLLVKTPPPVRYARTEFLLRPLPARLKSVEEQEDDLFERIATVLRQYPEGLSKRALHERVGGKTAGFLSAIDALVSSGKLTIESGPKRSQVIKIGKEEA